MFLLFIEYLILLHFICREFSCIFIIFNVSLSYNVYCVLCCLKTVLSLTREHSRWKTCKVLLSTLLNHLCGIPHYSKKMLQSPHSIKWLLVHRLIQESRYRQHWFSSFAMLLLRYRPQFWRLSCHLPAGTGRRPKNLSQVLYISFPEEDLCLAHEFS